MQIKDRNRGFRKLLIKWFALLIGVFYLISPFQHHLSDVLHSLSHDFSLPDYIMTHSGDFSNENINTHQYGDHRTDEVVHEHQFIDFVQSVLEDNSADEQQPAPTIPTKKVDKHLVIYRYKLQVKDYYNHLTMPETPRQNTCIGHTTLWQEPPITSLL